MPTATKTNNQNYYTPVRDNSHTKSTKEQIALWWLRWDYFLLPVQPNSKKLVPGFGFYQDKIRTSERAAQWFSEKSLANLAVCGTQTSLILDFDDPDLYEYWSNQFPREAKTYTERTPHGGYHVFAHTWRESLKGVTLLKGVELKRVVLISPSVVENKPYIRGEGELLKVDAEIILFPLSQTPTIRPVLRAEQDKGHLQKIKSAFSCLDLLQSSKSKLKVYGSSNRFVTVTCPFHDDQEPSFWIDTERNLWGCHACDIRGDVINLYARLKGITNTEAIREMGKAL